MPVTAADVVIGAIFRTASDQLRKVTSVKKDDQGRVRVHYIAKSANFKNRKFEFGGPTKANPPLLENFLADCGKLLSAAEIAQLRKDQVILAGE